MMDYDDEEDVRFNRRLGIDDNREGDEWNAAEYLRSLGAEVTVTAFQPPAQPRKRPLYAVVPHGLLGGALLAYQHYTHLKFWRPSHDQQCRCGQPDDGEPVRIETPTVGGDPVAFNDLTE